MQEQVAIWGWDGAAPWVPVLVDAAGHLQVDVLSGVGVASQCYGWDSANWQRLTLEGVGLHNLRVKLYDGANGIDSDTLDGNLTTERALLCKATLLGRVGPNDFQPMRVIGTGSDGLTNLIKALAVQSFLVAYNGTYWDRLRMESAAAHNLRVKLYNGANGIDSHLIDTSSLVATERGLVVKAQITGYHGFPLISGPDNVDNVSVSTSNSRLMTLARLYGFDGSNWDRLRTWGVGVLKVGRAEVDSTTTRLVAAGQVIAGAHNLYWLTCNPSAGSSVFELSDDTDGLSATVLDCFSTNREGKGFTFDPPMKFATGIYLKTFTAMTSMIFCYV